MESIAAVLFAANETSYWWTLIRIAIVCVALIGPFVLGAVIANALRMRDYAWKIGLILCAISSAVLILWNIWDPVSKRFNFKLGVDLQGGVILVYEVEQSVKFRDDLSAKGRTAVEPADSEVSEFSMSALIEALSRRINPAGTKEIVIRPYGDRQVEIIIPEVDQREVDHIKKVISTAGVLQFRIVANTRDHRDIIELARDTALDPVKKRSRVVFDESGAEVGLWARVGRETDEIDGIRAFKVDVSGFTVRDALTGDLLELPNEVMNSMSGQDDDDRRKYLARWVAERGLKEIDVLMETNDGLNVNGSHLGGVSKSHDEFMNPCINFNLKDIGAGLFGELTGRFSPEGQFHRQLGIVLDNDLLSAPNIQERISDRGRITGRFTDEEVQFLVNILQAGSLPVVLNKNPISSSLISPLLGEETIRQGTWAMYLAVGLVFLFMLVYYRFSGILASIVLALNILFTLALIVLIKAPLTLPGLAGLVLTVGMAVDSNVLIYERIREELARGSALRMALRNGFNRATTTIVDSNLTTVLTALILYAIGTDQLRGFAVTLTLGIITSMFTAIFCSRVFFDIVDRTRLLTNLKMFQFIGATNIDFIGYRRFAVAASLVVIGIGVLAAGARGFDMLDIDFTGGSSVHVMLEDKAETEQVRKLLDTKFQELKVPYSLTGMSMTPGDTRNNMFKIDAKIGEVEELEAIIHEAFQKSGGELKLATYSLAFSNLRETAVPTSPTSSGATTKTESADTKAEKEKQESTTATKDPDTKVEAATTSSEAATPPADPATKDDAKKDEASPPKETDPKSDEPAQPKANEGASAELPPSTFLALAAQETQEKSAATSPQESQEPAKTNAPPTEPADKAAAEAKSELKKESDAPATAAPDTQPATTASPEAAAAPNTPDTAIQIESTLTFDHGINASTLRAEIDEAARHLNIPLSYFDVDNPEWDRMSSNTFKTWTVRFSSTKENAQTLLDHLKAKFANEPVWPSSNKIGPTVAGRMQRTAITALVASWLGIIVYVWIRFQNLVFGLAAVVALVHDVLITVTALAVSHWVAGSLGFLLIEDFKISLTIVAALLTIIGYSINDTIVIFDRIREVRGKSPDITAQMINRSVNQTLSRTLLTFFTTFVVIVVLYALGGQGIHGFAFAMLIGMLTGTYSTVFIATPFVLWLAGKTVDATPKPLE